MDWPGWDKIAQKAVKEALDAVTVEIGKRGGVKLAKLRDRRQMARGVGLDDRD